MYCKFIKKTRSNVVTHRVIPGDDLCKLVYIIYFFGNDSQLNGKLMSVRKLFYFIFIRF
jgi:hypothetical protein